MEDYEEMLLRISEVLRRRFILFPKITEEEAIQKIREIVREDSQECSNVTDAESNSPKMKPTQG